MVNEEELKQYYEKFEKMQRWMIDDLRNASIKAQANLLVGMGIFNYIEILGSFYHYDEKKTKNKQRFDFAFGLMGSDYSNVFHKLNTLTKKGAYDVLRCGLTHEYLIKAYRMKEGTMDFTIYGVGDVAQYVQNIISVPCGIELVTIDQKHYHMRIYNPRLIHDLNLAFESYKSKLRSDARYEDETYRERFLERCKNINFKDFN